MNDTGVIDHLCVHSTGGGGGAGMSGVHDGVGDGLDDFLQALHLRLHTPGK